MSKKLCVSLITLCACLGSTSYAVNSPRRIDKNFGNNPPPKAQPLSLDVSYNLHSNQPGNLTFKSTDGNFVSHIGGYVQADTIHYLGEAKNFSNSSQIRRGRFQMDGSFYQHWGYALSYEFAANGGGGMLASTYLSYSNGPYVNVTAGQIPPVFGLSNADNVTATTFLEIPLATALYAPAYSAGVEYLTEIPSIGSFAVSGFYPGVDQPAQGNDPFSYTSRLVIAPFHKNAHILHLGGSFWHQSVGRTSQVAFTEQPEVSNRDGTAMLNAIVGNISYYNVYDAELAGEYGPLSASAEYIHAEVHRHNGSADLSFPGYYGTISYFLTGEHRTYSYPDGFFTGISPIRHSYGAWQIAARYSTLNLDDKDIQGGKQSDISLGVNWYPVQLVQFMLDYIHSKADPATSQAPFMGRDDDANIIAARLQVMF